jgi:hypothetical protein
MAKDKSREKMEAARRVTDAAVKSGKVKKKKERLEYKPPTLTLAQRKARADAAAARARKKEAGTAPGQVKDMGRKVSGTAKKMQSFLKKFGA